MTTNLPHLLGAALLALATLPAAAQRIELPPGQELLEGEPFTIAASGLAPGATVTLRATRLVAEFTGGQRAYRAQARFVADAQGRVEPARQAPLPGGSYTGTDLRGLFWSMAPAPAGTAAPAAQQLAFELLAGEGGGEPLAQATLQLRRALPAVQQRKAEGFPGAVFAVLPGGGRRPALILLGGSEGGSLITRDAAVWASRGYAVLALPYYSPPGWGPNGATPPELPALPPAFAEIPLERLEAAREWLARQPEADATRVGVMGTSKGAEFALLAATRMPWIRAVVAIVPTDVVWEGWGPGIAAGTRSSFAWRGEPLPFVPYLDFDKEFAGFATGGEVRIRRPQDKGRAAHPGRVPAARIPVERIAAPVLVAGAHDDQVWDSGGMAQAIADARQQAALPTVALVFKDAGHALGGAGLSPTTQYNAGPMKMGGTPEATARAQAETFAATVAFLQQHLQAQQPAAR